MGMLDWRRIFPDERSISSAELHLLCEAHVLFFDPVNCVGVIWWIHQEIGHSMGPITAPEFVRGALARGVTLPQGPRWEHWAAAITDGLVRSSDCRVFLRIAAEMDYLAAAPGAGDQAH